MSLDIKKIQSDFITPMACDLDEIIEQAYRDLQPRTIKHHTAEVKSAGALYLKSSFEKLLAEIPLSDEAFEERHHEICEGFLETVNAFPYIEKQQYGKAQKVVNIIFKFLVAYGIYQNADQCHMPIDSFALRWLTGKDRYNGRSWSNLSYRDYKELQQMILEKIKAPIVIGDCEVIAKNRVEADFYVWYVTKAQSRYRDATNALKRLRERLSHDDASCVGEKTVTAVLSELEALRQELAKLLKQDN